MKINDLKIPKGWTLEPMERERDYVLLSTPSPDRYMATLDLRGRGFRAGMTTYGLYVGERMGNPGGRKRYEGRGWQQAIVDAAIAHLQELL